MWQLIGVKASSLEPVEIKLSYLLCSDSISYSPLPLARPFSGLSYK